MLEFDKTTGEVFADGPVGDYFEDGFDARQFRDALRAMGGRSVSLTITSPGGDVFQGMSIVNQIRSYSGEVTVKIDAIAASIASVIASAANRTLIYEGSQMMLHNAWTIDIGDAEDFRRTAEMLDGVDRDIAGVYARKSGKHEDEILDMMAQDKYWRADELLDLGLVDAVIRPDGESKQPSNYSRTVASVASFPRAAMAQHRMRSWRTKS